MARIGVIQCSYRARLPFKAFTEMFYCDFDRYITSEPGIVSPVNFTHTS